MRLRRFLKKLESEGVVTLTKIDGLVWVKPNFNNSKLVDLIKSNTSKTQTNVTSINSRFKHYARFEASGFLMHKHSLTPKDWDRLDGLLGEYVEDVSSKVIVIGRQSEVGGFEVRFLRYSHRFTSRRLYEILKVYDTIWKNISSKFNVGVFITLTLDPKTYSNLYQASKYISKAFNRFMSFLAKRLGFRPPYIAVFEPMDNGNPHLHVVIFGIKRIESHWRLTHLLKSEGFGEVHFEYQIKRNGDSWVWANRKSRPRTASMNVKHYLKKYLVKVFKAYLNGNGEEKTLAMKKLAFYFATNKRFFTCSRALMVKREVGVKVRVLGEWFFIGSWYWLDVPDWVLGLSNAIIVYDERLVWRILTLYTTT